MRNTIIWVAVVIFLAASHVLQDPADDPYTQAVRGVFTLILVVLVPLISAVVVFALGRRAAPSLRPMRRRGLVSTKGGG